VRLTRRSRLATYLSVTVLAAAGPLIGVATPAFAGTPTLFTPGDLVVEQVGTVGGATPSSTSAPVSLWDYSTSGVASGYVVSLPTTDGSGSHALVESGSATNNGEISLSGDGQYLYVPGYDTSVGTTKLTSTTGVPRTIGIVSASGTVDTSTALTGTALTATKVNFRTATGASGGSSGIYSGGDAGVAESADGATTGTSLDAAAVDQLEVVNGQLYESGTSSGVANIYKVGTGLPTSGTQTDTPLIASPPAGFSPDGFAFANLGSGVGPDTLYVADTGNNAVEKFSYNGTTWVLKGSVTVPVVTGIAVSVSSGVAHLYVTNGTSTSAAFNSVLSGLTDSSGTGGTFTSTVTGLATAPTGESFKGVAFAPGTLVPNNGDTPEAPWAIALPALAAAGMVVYVLRRRRRQAA
jgi:hypothetical protein